MQNEFLTQCRKLKYITLIGAATKKWKKLAGRSKDRFYRLRQLVQTEEDYQKDLNCINNKMRIPLVACGAITDQEANHMFSNVEAMIGLSVQLKEELTVKLETWNRKTTVIGLNMTRFSKFLLVYADFFKNFNETQHKLKLLLQTKESVREIEKQLTVGPRIITFEDLMSKPFQRPLKYHLILRDYASKTDQSHPDFLPLKQAINCYHKVNEQNNLSLQNKEKDQRLLTLDVQFGNVINSEARNFVKQFEATFIDLAVTLYIFSDMVILSQKEVRDKEKEFNRIYFNKYSHVEAPPDGHYFINRLFFYGKRLCAHLTFFRTHDRDEVYSILSSLIQDMSKNEVSRQQLINQRVTRQSVVEKRKSYTQLQPQFKRPMIVNVLGNQKRVLGQQKIILYYILQFHPTLAKWNDPTPPHQISLVTVDTLLRIQKLCFDIYSKDLCLSINHHPKGLTEYQAKKDEFKKLEFQNIFVQLQLNTIFRNEQILKRIDIFCHLLKMSDSLWRHLKQQNFCPCVGCCIKDPLKDVKEYFLQKRARFIKKNETSRIGLNRRGTQYCDLRTLHAQQMLAGFSASNLKAYPAECRLIWVKSTLGWINHSMTSLRTSTKKLNFTIRYCSLSNIDTIEIEFYPHERVKQLLDFIGQRMSLNLEDYALSANINGTFMMLDEDQVIGDVVLPPPKKQQSGVFGSFVGFFKSEEYYKVTLYLKKMWVLQYPMECLYDFKKIIYQMQEIIFRLKRQQLKLGDEELQQIYAYYLSYRHFTELDLLTFNKLNMKKQQLEVILPNRLNTTNFIERIYYNIEKIKKNSQIDKNTVLALKIIEMVCLRPGWSCIFFDGFLKSDVRSPGTMMVKIGCDLKGIKIRQTSKAIMMLEFKFSSKNWTCDMNNLQLIIREEKEYSFVGRDLWKVKRQIDFYKLYYFSFLDK